MKVSNSYGALGEAFSIPSLPEKAPKPKLILWNEPLAKEFEVFKEILEDPYQQTSLFSGNTLLEGASPLAMAYAGHQFGHFSPQLGDGRAHLLFDTVDKKGVTYDVQLKGSGRTPFSRGGDGKCALGPAAREYIMSEAMHALGVATSRSLCVVATGESLYRQNGMNHGAIITRIASSHLRVGSLEFFAARQKTAEVKTLLDFAAKRHFPQVSLQNKKDYLFLLEKIMKKQIDLVVSWSKVGFIHGVMNTDNTALSGQTIDYGPCAMMNNYDPATVYSSIDREGRYSFGNQKKIALWNLTRLAECMLPLIDDNKEKAISLLNETLETFIPLYKEAFESMMAKKLGFLKREAIDAKIAAELLEVMHKNGLDYTLTFSKLTRSLMEKEPLIEDSLKDWHYSWQKRLLQEDKKASYALMAKNNPVLIPRNHHVEEVLAQLEETLDPSSCLLFLEALKSPYKETPLTKKYQAPPEDNDTGYQTFCGT